MKGKWFVEEKKRGFNIQMAIIRQNEMFLKQSLDPRAAVRLKKDFL